MFVDLHAVSPNDPKTICHRISYEKLVNQEIRVWIENFSHVNRTFFFSQFCVASDHVRENDLSILRYLKLV